MALRRCRKEHIQKSKLRELEKGTEESRKKRARIEEKMSLQWLEKKSFGSPCFYRRYLEQKENPSLAFPRWEQG